jgi:hypothetical protein
MRVRYVCFDKYINLLLKLVRIMKLIIKNIVEPILKPIFIGINNRDSNKKFLSFGISSIKLSQKQH